MGRLVAERLEIYPFLGSGRLGRAIDARRRPGGAWRRAPRRARGYDVRWHPRLRNVAQPVIEAAYRVFECVARPAAGAAPSDATA